MVRATSSVEMKQGGGRKDEGDIKHGCGIKEEGAMKEGGEMLEYPVEKIAVNSKEIW
jgi:hypothetical protein